jgi:hypothetical protein
MFFLLSYDDFLKANFKKSIVLSYDILSDQNRYTHLKPLRNQGFQRFYALFFQSVFYRYTRAFKSVRKDLNSILG